MIDLHSHSTCSDGTYRPSELVRLAHAAGITTFALTDHDTIAGIDEAREQADKLGIRLINGVEISCQHRLAGGYGLHKDIDKVIHVVALDFDDRDQLEQSLARLQDSRAMRGQRMCAKLALLLDLDEAQLWQCVLAKVDGNAKTVGRAHIAQVLYEQGLVKTIQDAFDKYLGDNKSAYVRIDSLSMAQTIELIHRCRGLAVLAHPTRYNLSATRVRRLIDEFAQLGGDAVELPNQEPISTKAMIDRSVAKHQLMVSVGSDFHGTTMPWRKLGQVSAPKADQVGIWQSFD